MPQITAAQIAAGLEGHSPAQIAAGVARMVNEGTVSAGDRLPIVRDLATRLGVSTGTVGAAWNTLSALGLVESRGRAGTFVLPTPASWLPPRYRRARNIDTEVHLDLSTGTPDPSLLPDIREPLMVAAANLELVQVNSYLAPPVLPRLESLLQDTWPFRAQRITVVNGAMDGLIRTLNQVVRFGDRVAVESPGYPPVFDILDQLGLVRVPLGLDHAGATPGSVKAAIAAGARAMILQPRAQNPTGVSMTPTRVRELATIIRARTSGTSGGNRLVIIEDDHSGRIAPVRDMSLGTYLPDRVVHVRSYSKTHGPDLRIAGVGGPAHVVDAIVARRLMGAGWTSRVLQMVLASMLTDTRAQAAVAHASQEYANRRTLFAKALADNGLVITPGDGLTMWIPVANEEAAMARLLAAGIRASAGSEFLAHPENAPAPGSGGHLRITLGALRSDFDAVAAIVARAARA
ncbi:aminotransferase class I/II-fold pyridoxal phosphate-dependent enzyme [Brooklawnia cerclae]|uniref:DNA-binding transcriptional MocR family regulator n=1 Tax=Brooklawnia cerclae TaxID=349934 RepID=A0ABX0SFE6_9ACTN|nr:aminotransferase class I/II-fold pyridoxal phosphate-dependent enzyme [Brooklawnia cerclae]NIH57109.1 DNA-binding transcriptional MocR family regulator [Brooklawnia cerclae]